MKRWITILLPLVLAVPAVAGQKPGTEVEYAALLLGNKKLGYSKTTQTFTNKTVTTVSDIRLNILRGEMDLKIRMQVTHVETPAGEPLSFRMEQDMGVMAQTISGRVGKDGRFDVTINLAGRQTTRKLKWPRGALMSWGLERLARKKGLKEGTTYKCKIFSEETLTGLECTTVIGSKKKIDLLGRVAELTEVRQKLRVSSATMNLVSYMDDDFNIRKSTLPMLGMPLEIIACDKAFATSPSRDVPDFFDKLAVKSPRPLDKKTVISAKTITYKIRADKGAELSFPRTENQLVRKTAGGVLLTVSMPQITAGGAIPYAGDDKTALAALKPSRYIQSDAKLIRRLATQAVGNTTDAAQAVAKIQQFVHEYIKKKDLSVGYASALEVARSRQGDCSEHALLSAALCQAVGIPARIACGITYVNDWLGKKDVFLPHAWVLAYVNGKWIPLDAALNRTGPARIILAVGNGDIEEFFSMVNTLGNFRITAVTVEK